MQRSRWPVAAALLAVTALTALTACDYVTDPSPEPTTTASTTPSPTEPTGPTGLDGPSGSSEPESAETEPEPEEPASPTPPSEAEMPGEPVEGFPEVGTSLVITGVPAQEVLNLRIGPGIEFASVARLTPDTRLVATGRNRDTGGAGLWYQVRAGEDVGWVFARYVAEPGASRDVTDHFDPPPSADRPGDLVDLVVERWQPGSGDDEVVVFGPVVIDDDLQVRVDVPATDDSVVGARLFVVAARDDDVFTVTRVTATQLCARGVSGTGDCV